MRATRSTTREFLDLGAPDQSRAPHFRGLDGLRGLAVAGVVLYHLDLPALVGGYLGVSTFFTLSGFLITGVLLREAHREGGIGLRQFWGRRFRRLLPASLATLALVATLFAALVATVDQRAALRGDVLASLADIVNWRFIAQGTSYGASFGAPSPVLHFWSLAIEEQLYLVLPVLLLVTWRVFGGRTRRVGVVLLILAAASTALPFLFTMSQDRIYFGTDTRAAELLLGGVLAVVFTHPGVRRRIALGTVARYVVLAAGAVCLAVQLVWWWSLEQSTPWLYRGGFTVYALMTCVVITAAAMPSGPLRSLFGLSCLRWLGHRSYGIYLAHWPIILAVRQLRPELGTWTTAVVAVGATLAIAEVSYRLLEQPVRLGRWPSAPRAVFVSCTAIVLVAGLAVVSPTGEPSDRIDFAAAEAAHESRPVVTTIPTAPDVPPIPTVVTVGDSTSLLMALGMASWGRQSGRLVDVGGETESGCSVSRFATSRFDVDIESAPECTDWPDVWPKLLDEQHPLVAQLVTGVWEVADVRLPSTNTFSSIGDPAVDAFITSELSRAVDLLASSGALVIIVLWPGIGEWSLPGKAPAQKDQADPRRMQRLHEIERRIAAERPDSVRILDLEGWLGDRAHDPELRPDGTHISPEDMLALYEDGLGDETERIFREWWSARRDPAPQGGG